LFGQIGARYLEKPLASGDMRSIDRAVRVSAQSIIIQSGSLRVSNDRDPERESQDENQGKAQSGKPKAGFLRRLFGRRPEAGDAEPANAEPANTEPSNDGALSVTPDEAPPSEPSQGGGAAPQTLAASPAILAPAPPESEAAPIEPAPPSLDDAAPSLVPADASSLVPPFVPPAPIPPPLVPEPETTPEPVPSPAAPPAAASAAPAAPKKNWWARLTEGLARSSQSIGSGIAEIFTKRKLDAAALDDLEDVLIRADLGVAAAMRIREAVSQGRYNKDVDVETVKSILANEVAQVLAPVAKPLEFDPRHKPFVILVVGVNGSGKTTTIGKLAARFSREGRKLLLVAGDTFRAAAIEQLRIWGDTLNCPVMARDSGGDAAGLAFDAIKAAKENGTDILIMDTAGRLQNRTELMAELEKIIRVMKKLDPEAPHAVLLVLDATVGQNAMSQVEIFGRVAGVTGLVMTKLDGTARGGILVAVAEKYKLPIHFIGVGETADDLQAFAAEDFARAIAGLGA
jgi:fused signal recognition particle receptor